MDFEGGGNHNLEVINGLGDQIGCSDVRSDIVVPFHNKFAIRKHHHNSRAGIRLDFDGVTVGDPDLVGALYASPLHLLARF